VTEAERIYKEWLCAECYGKHFIAGFKHGVTSEIVVDAVRNTQLTLNIGGTSVVLVGRNYTKHSRYKHEFFNPHGVAPNGPIDTSYVSYFDASCWGTESEEYAGEYSVSSAFENSQIYFADLREDILVYYHEAGSSSGSAEGNAAMGQGIAFASWQGADRPGCRGVNTLDAIKMPINLHSSTIKKELISLGGLTPYAQSVDDPQSFNIAASDRSGYCGGVSFECNKWGEYARIDTAKPYDCAEGVYVEDALPDALEDYFNAWDAFGAFRSMDEYDRSVWDGSFNKQGVDRIADGVHAYPSFVDIDPLPHGSWCVDAEGNRFYSQITKDLQVFNKLDTLAPETIANLTGSGVVFYPVAPV
jgi:hypothetical protein